MYKNIFVKWIPVSSSDVEGEELFTPTNLCLGWIEKKGGALPWNGFYEGGPGCGKGFKDKELAKAWVEKNIGVEENSLSEKVLEIAGNLLDEFLEECPIGACKNIHWAEVPICDYNPSSDMCHNNSNEFWASYLRFKSER